MANHIVQKISTTTDSEGRTQMQQVTIVRKTGSEPDFVKMYLKFATHLRFLTARERDVLGELLIRMDYNNNVSVPNGIREDICRSLKMFKKKDGGNCKNGLSHLDDFGSPLLSIGGLNVVLNKLCKHQVISRLSKGVYTINPQLFGKGKWMDIQQIRTETRERFSTWEQKELLKSKKQIGYGK